MTWLPRDGSVDRPHIPKFSPMTIKKTLGLLVFTWFGLSNTASTFIRKSTSTFVVKQEKGGKFYERIQWISNLSGGCMTMLEFTPLPLPKIFFEDSGCQWCFNLLTVPTSICVTGDCFESSRHVSGPRPTALISRLKKQLRYRYLSGPYRRNLQNKLAYSSTIAKMLLTRRMTNDYTCALHWELIEINPFSLHLTSFSLHSDKFNSLNSHS